MKSIPLLCLLATLWGFAPHAAAQQTTETVAPSETSQVPEGINDRF